MKYRLTNLIYHRYRDIFIQETRNYAGHSKWQNIKHIKQEQDTARSQLFRSIILKMKAVITETGNPHPAFNPKLASLVEHAKKVNMPADTLKSFLDKMQNIKENNEIYIIPLQSSTGVTLILHVATDNVTEAKLNIRHIIKKHNVKIADSSILTTFDCASYVTALKDCNIDQAMEDAIATDVDDVEEIKKDDGSTCFKFKTEFLFPDKTISQLRSHGYSILSTENKCIPNSLIELEKTELKGIDNLKQKLCSEIKEIKKIEDNIAPL